MPGKSVIMVPLNAGNMKYLLLILAILILLISLFQVSEVETEILKAFKNLGIGTNIPSYEAIN